MDHDLDQAHWESTERWMRVGLVLMFALALVFPFYRWYEPASRAAAAEEHTANLAASGEKLYDDSCASCHGSQGRGGMAPAVGAVEFLDATDDTQLRQLIAVGVPGSEMVAYSQNHGGPMTWEQITAIAAYLRSLSEDGRSIPNWRAPLSDEDLTGGELFVLGCARCHGIDLAGTDDGPSLGIGSDAVEESDGRLTRRIREGGDDMPGFEKLITEEQIALLVSFLRAEQAGG